MIGIIERIKVYSAKGEKGRFLSGARLIENLGLEGDYNAKGGERQISLLLMEIYGLLAAQEETGLCFSRFKENISIRGIAPEALKPGVRLEAGETELEISGETKSCHEECALYKAGETCPLAGLSLFAKVVKSGVIHVGDGVELR